MILTAPQKTVLSSETLAILRQADYENHLVRVRNVERYGWVLPLAVLSACLTHLALEWSIEPLWFSLFSILIGIVATLIKHKLAALMLIVVGGIGGISEISWRAVHVSPDQTVIMQQLLHAKKQRKGSVPALTTYISGQVVESPERPRPGEMRIVLRGVAGQRLSGKFQLTLPDLPWHKHSLIRLGDSITGMARLRATSLQSLPLMSYERVLARRGILGTGRAWNIEVFPGEPDSERKSHFVKQVLAHWGCGDETTLILSLLLGERHLVSDTVSRVFRETGTSHFLAVSGFHLAIICGAVWRIVWMLWSLVPRLLSYVPVRTAGAIASVLVASLYTHIVGWELTVVRSLIVVIMFSLGEIVGRRTPPSRTLLLALLAVELVWPSCFLEPSCQLTFAALTGLWAGSVWIPSRELNRTMPHAPGMSLRRRLWRAVASSLALNVGAWICTAPIVVFWFKGFSIASVMINTVVIGIFSLPVMLSGIVALTFDWLGLIGGAVTWRLASVMMSSMLSSLEQSRVFSAQIGLGYRVVSDEQLSLIVFEFALIAILWLALSCARNFRPKAADGVSVLAR